MKNNLVICPNCIKLGKRQVLCEINPDSGDVAVMRFHKGYTLITGSNFQIYCGECKELVFHKEHLNGTVIKERTTNVINAGSFLY